MDCSLPGSSVHGISQARILEWVAISFSRGSSQSRDWACVLRTAGWLFTVLSHQEKISVNVKSSPFVGYNARGGVFEETTSLPLLPCWCGPIILCFGADVQLRLPYSSSGKESTCNAEDTSLIPGSGRSLRKGIGYPLQYSWASLVAQMVNYLPPMQETSVWPCVEKIPWRRACNQLQYSCLEHPHGQRSLAGYSPWGSRRVGHNWVTKHSTVAQIFC